MSGRSHSLCRVFHSLVFFLLSSGLQADTLSLKNGNLLTGKIRELADNKVHLDTEWAGVIKVDLRYVQTMETEKLLWVRMKGQDNFRLVRLYQRDNETWLVDDQGNSSLLDSQQRLAALKENRPGENQWLLSGKANVNFALKRGVDSEDELKTFGSMNIRDRVNRNIFGWESDYSRENGVMDDKEIKFTYDYNRFLDRSWYVLGSGLWLYDADESPYSRYSVGTGVGYQFWDRGDGSLKSDIGGSRLWEDYRSDNNLSRWALRWGLNAVQRLDGNLYGTADSTVYYQLGGEKQLLWDLDLGLKYQVTDRLWFNMRYSLDLDSTPPSDGVRSKTSVTFGLGFGW